MNLVTLTRACSILLLGSSMTATAFAQNPATIDACQANPSFCLPKADNAAKALEQLLNTSANPLAPNPPEFFTIYGGILSQFVNAQVSNLSQGSSLAGFSFVRDSATGALQLKSTNFGPLLSERPQTGGKKAFALSLTSQRTRFKSFDGTDLDSRGLIDEYDFTTGVPPGQDKFLTYAATFHVTTTSTVVGMSYGVNDRLDISGAVPFVSTTVAGVNKYDFEAVGGLDQSMLLQNISGTSSGLGDITVRGKYHFLRGASDWAALLEQRLPTGDENKLLGLGKAQTKVAVLGSVSRGMFNPHWTIGYTWAGEGIKLGELHLVGADQETFRVTTPSVIEPSNEFNYSVGLDVPAHPRVTVAAEIVGRNLRHSARLTDIVGFSRTHFKRTVSFFEGVDSLNMVIGTAGAKWNVAGSWLLVGNVLFPLTDNGLKLGVTPVISIQKAFSGRQ